MLRIKTHHRICLTCACLTISKYCAIIAFINLMVEEQDDGFNRDEDGTTQQGFYGKGKFGKRRGYHKGKGKGLLIGSSIRSMASVNV